MTTTSLKRNRRASPSRSSRCSPRCSTGCWRRPSSARRSRRARSRFTGPTRATSGSGNYRQVDDTPYGGGPGMVMRVEPIAAALDAIAAARGPSHRILLTPRGRRFDQAGARALAARPRVTLVCGRYEGVDERVAALVDDQTLHRRLRAGGRRAGGGGRARGDRAAGARACSAAGCRRATSRSRPGASNTRSGRARPTGTGRRCRRCCCRAITRRSSAGAGARRCG